MKKLLSPQKPILDLTISTVDVMFSKEVLTGQHNYFKILNIKHIYIHIGLIKNCNHLGFNIFFPKLLGKQCFV